MAVHEVDGLPNQFVHRRAFGEQVTMWIGETFFLRVPPLLVVARKVGEELFGVDGKKRETVEAEHLLARSRCCPRKRRSACSVHSLSRVKVELPVKGGECPSAYLF